VALLNAASDPGLSAKLRASHGRLTDANRHVGNAIKALLGKDTAEYLLYRLGPNDGRLRGAEPISQRLANVVRGMFVVQARADSCEVQHGLGLYGRDSDLLRGRQWCQGQDVMAGVRLGSGTTRAMASASPAGCSAAARISIASGRIRFA